jgi:DegV family protein with EDD domain
MSIKVVTDSTCDLPQSVVSTYDIHVIPCYINMGDKSYLDGVELSRREFYERLPDCHPHPTTSAPGIANFVEVYKQLIAEGASGIISIHISAQLSNVVNVARLAAETIKAVPMTVIDAGQLTIGTGLQALVAAKASAAGQSMRDIVAAIKEKATCIHTIATLDTLEYLQRSGRLSKFQSLMGTLLKIKPLLSMHTDTINMERVRTQQRALAWLLDYVKALGPLEQVVLVHTNARDKAEELQQKAHHLLENLPTPWAVDVSPVLGAHLGPGVIGFTCVTAT